MHKQRYTLLRGLALILQDEYNVKDNSIAVNELYAVNTVDVSKLIPISMAAKQNHPKAKIDFSIYDTARNKKYTSDEAGFKIESIPISTGSDERRLPYMCENNKLFKYENRIVIDVATGTFNTPNAIKLGDEICAAISIIPTYK